MEWGEGESLSTEEVEPAISGEIMRLRESAVAFCHRAEQSLLPGDIGQQMSHLSHTIDMLKVQLSQLAGVFAATGEAERQGCLTDIDWVRHNCRLSGSDAAELVVVGEHLGQLPRSRDAVEDGRIGFGHLLHLARNAAFCAHPKKPAFDDLARRFRDTPPFR